MGGSPPAFFAPPFFSFSFRRKKRTAAASEEACSIPLPPGRRKLHIRSLLLPSRKPTAVLGRLSVPIRKGKRRPGKPFGWFPRTPSIDQSLALDLRRMEVGESTIDFVGADAERSCSRRRSVTDAACPLRVLIGPYKHNRSAAQDRKKQSASLWTEGGA